jgi:dihydrofolate synthase/folylpolyglutamate synthase
MRAGKPVDFYSRLKRLNEFKFDFSLERVKRALELSGNPQDSFFVIHVAGSNGKGSVASYLANILSAHGYKTGTYTSPHLTDVKERMLIDGKKPSEGKFRSEGLKLFKLLDDNKIRLTYFEFLTVLAFILFRLENVKAAVVEAGLGGRLDATNADYGRKILSVITSISLEHTAILGNTVKKILVEKEQIIGGGKAVVNIGQEPLKKYLKKKYGGNIIFADEAYPVESVRAGKTALEIKIRKEIYRTQMIETVQAKNISTVLSALEVMGREGMVFERRKIKDAILRTILPGRMTLSNKGYYLSVAHNPAAVKEALDTLVSVYPGKRIVYLFSALNDKDVGAIFGTIAKRKNISLVLTDIGNERGFQKGGLLKAAEKAGLKPAYYPDNKEALRQALKIKDNGIILIGGSFYLVKEFI